MVLYNGGFGLNVLIFDRLGSTNDYLKEEGASLPDKTVVIAKEQYAGKGRLGRSWQDSEGDTLCMSALVHTPSIHDTQLLPFVCGLSARKALSELFSAETGLKWVNDVVCHGKKVAGILCESRVQGANIFSVMGIGVNVGQSRDYFDKSGLPWATSMQIESGLHKGLLEAAEAVLKAMDYYYAIFQQQGFTSLCTEYNQYCVNIGRQVRATYPDRVVEGIARKVETDGSLAVETGEGKIEFIRTGEASLRGMYGYY